jgi:hypothetical protein
VFRPPKLSSDSARAAIALEQQLDTPIAVYLRALADIYEEHTTDKNSGTLIASGYRWLADNDREFRRATGSSTYGWKFSEYWASYEVNYLPDRCLKFFEPFQRPVALRKRGQVSVKHSELYYRAAVAVGYMLHDNMEAVTARIAKLRAQKK